MKQPHTESTVQHTDDQQNTGNHKKPGSPDANGADKFGGHARAPKTSRSQIETTRGNTQPTDPLPGFKAA